jgi:hypothetical protein
LRGGQGAFARKSDFPLYIVAGLRSRRKEANAGFVVPYIDSVVFTALVAKAKISANIMCFQWLLNPAQSIAVQSTLCWELGH